MSATTTPRSRRSGDRREELLDAAQELFAEHGVAATSVAQITERAGVGKGTFYLYFDSKQHVVVGLKERAMEVMADLADETVSRIGEAEFFELADELTARIIDYWIDQRDVFRAIREAGETPGTAQLWLQHDERVIELLEAGIRVGIEMGEVDVDDPRRAAQYIYYGFDGMTIMALLTSGPVERDALVAAAQDIIRRILRP